MVSAIEDNLRRVNDSLAEAAAESGRAVEEVRLVAVTKTYSVDAIAEAVRCGVREIGENRAQELEEKKRLWQGSHITWRFIGHLQTNKVKKAVEFASTVDSVDSVRLARALSMAAEERGLVLPVLMEVNTSGEESKHGVHPSQAEQLVEVLLRECPGLRLDGLMTIGPLTEDEVAVRGAFAMLRTMRDKFARSYGAPLRELSMGMSGDFGLAIKEGSTMVRIGSAIFGRRN